MTQQNQRRRLAQPFPSDLIKRKAGASGGDYVAHETINQRLLQVLGPFDLHVAEIVRGDVLAVEPNPRSNSRRGKEGTPALQGIVVAVVVRLVVEIDGRSTAVEEIGEVDDVHNWAHDGLRLKAAMSDGLKRAAMRLGCGLHLWAPDAYFLPAALDRDAAAQTAAPDPDPADTPTPPRGTAPAPEPAAEEDDEEGDEEDDATADSAYVEHVTATMSGDLVIVDAPDGPEGLNSVPRPLTELQDIWGEELGTENVWHLAGRIVRDHAGILTAAVGEQRAADFAANPRLLVPASQDKPAAAKVATEMVLTAVLEHRALGPHPDGIDEAAYAEGLALGQRIRATG
jgi:hypothetical protein